MNKLILLLLLIGWGHAAKAQYSLNGKWHINAGTGISNYGVPGNLGFEIGLARDVTFAVEGTYREFTDNRVFNKIIGGSAMLNYHLNYLFGLRDDSWDVYIGGYYNVWGAHPKIQYMKLQDASTGFGGQFGLRYFMTEHVGVYTELSAGPMVHRVYLSNGSTLNATVKLGLTYRFPAR